MGFSKYCLQTDQKLANKLAYALKKHFEIRQSSFALESQSDFKASKIKQLIKKKRF